MLATEFRIWQLSLPERDGADYQRAEIRRDEGMQILNDCQALRLELALVESGSWMVEGLKTLGYCWWILSWYRSANANEVPGS